MIAVSVSLLSRLYMFWTVVLSERRPSGPVEQVAIYQYNTNYPFF
jgi:hypothetical protein